MEECFPLGIYVHCYRHVLNLAFQGTMTQIEPLRNVLETIQALYNFLEASPKRHDTRSIWYGQMERIVIALLTLFSDKDPKAYSKRRASLTAICNLEFIFGLCVLTVILNNTTSLKWNDEMMRYPPMPCLFNVQDAILRNLMSAPQCCHLNEVLN